ncbi:hypothetical protein UFOVP1028_3 [uncultured Caudovirales phage]|uniref:Uncharacterized protein n=1 Tax=uncultured Caudovirales phage TaxID=2100421 RepID=A0A6J5PPQ2_9CAUD|nr:hypothetical protein UFOVP960_14 [uncultured Caudovirales phage]CAB4178773.1 hypothetical protein UFOVP1028_3 [uncultured Caudovirales phage]CAB4189430.1 hypothetical protein UFOVP1187_16 [uncultured Caudovirales phage]CAB4192410.1 hypothetical protein UFOVP1235_33 [uncultured Caudovirales phage]CAB4215815.1 hypothetical protein UFOVP1488_16 [uncultured Caudovirales phage]
MTDMTAEQAEGIGIFDPSIPEHHCDATTGWQLRADGYGFEPVPCQQWRGLRVVVALNGWEYRACGAAGHLAQVIRKVGQQ